MELIVIVLLVVLIPSSLLLIVSAMQAKSGTLKMNNFLGIRTVETMRSEETWKVAHKACASTLMAAGVIGLLLAAGMVWSAFSKPEWMYYFTGAYVVVVSGGVILAGQQAKKAVKEMDTRA